MGRTGQPREGGQCPICERWVAGTIIERNRHMDDCLSQQPLSKEGTPLSPKGPAPLSPRGLEIFATQRRQVSWQDFMVKPSEVELRKRREAMAKGAAIRAAHNGTPADDSTSLSSSPKRGERGERGIPPIPTLEDSVTSPIGSSFAAWEKKFGVSTRKSPPEREEGRVTPDFAHGREHGRERTLSLEEFCVLEKEIASETPDTAAYKLSPPPGDLRLDLTSLISQPIPSASALLKSRMQRRSKIASTRPPPEIVPRGGGITGLLPLTPGTQPSPVTPRSFMAPFTPRLSPEEADAQFQPSKSPRPEINSSMRDPSLRPQNAKGAAWLQMEKARIAINALPPGPKKDTAKAKFTALESRLRIAMAAE